LKLEQCDTKKLTVMLDQLASAIEELLLTGLTTASDATVQTLNISFQEASRAGLLRLGSTLRVACEELTRYTKEHPDFSAKRFSFFLNRSWLLSKGLSKAIKESDREEFERLTWNAPVTPVRQLEVVTLGVSKKYVPNAFCAFEFRMRRVEPAGVEAAASVANGGVEESGARGTTDVAGNTGTAGGGILPGQKLIWSVVFPVKPNQNLPPESFLHLPQKQKFIAYCLIEGRRVTFGDAFVAFEKSGTGRISLGDKSTVMQGDEYTDWSKFISWSPEAAIDRLNAYEPGPLDLEIELQEEVFIEDWEMLPEPLRETESHIVYPLSYRGGRIDAVVSRGLDGATMRAALDKAVAQKKKPVVFGLMHYEKCRLTLQPLSFLGKKGPEYATLSRDKVDRVALLKALNL
jgi:hypothetical protein